MGLFIMDADGEPTTPPPLRQTHTENKRAHLRCDLQKPFGRLGQQRRESERRC